MRVTSQTKLETRRRILDAGRHLFAARGFESSSTRELSTAAGIAAGTLFNYFPTKEALALTLIGEAFERAEATFLANRRAGAELDEELFAKIASELRELEPCRAWLGEVIESALSPLSRSSPIVPGEVDGSDLRARHLQAVQALLAERALVEGASAIAMHLYWTLYLGVLSFWSNDASPGQEDTLVLLDRSMSLFAASIQPPSGNASHASP